MHSQALPTVAEPFAMQPAAPALGSVPEVPQRSTQNGIFKRAQSLQTQPRAQTHSARSAPVAHDEQAEDDMRRQFSRVKWSDKPSLAASNHL